ncbi:MAG: transglutaminase family protein, partial [Croceibacterium sp.]
ADIGSLNALAPHELPGETVHYLLDSRYCAADRFQSFVQDEFGDLQGGPRILAIRDWVAGNIKYTPGSSTDTTTALDSFVERRGVCRDYAHVLITLARASAIPARYVSCYAPMVDPPDFHAVAEVFLADPAIPGGGAWHLVDATGMADPAATVKIGVGRDAADVSFMTVFGEAEFVDKCVIVTGGG